jgi:uncharacterized protein (DUF983 family)
MRNRNFLYIWHKIKVGFSLRCPNCERGQLFEQRFRMRTSCAYCHARFERSSGDALGGVYINVAVAELTALVGFFTLDSLLRLPVWVHLAIWLPYVLIVILLFYRHARGIWVAVSYLFGGIYPDFDCDREYIGSAPVIAGRTPQEHEE